MSMKVNYVLELVVSAFVTIGFYLAFPTDILPLAIGVKPETAR